MFDFKLNCLFGNIYNKVLPFLLTVLVALTSCSGEKPLEFKPLKTKIVNVTDLDEVFNATRRSESISEYIEVINATYSMIPLTEEGTKKWRIDVKFKSIKKANQEDEFNIGSTGTTPGGTGLYLVDKVGTTYEGLGGGGQFNLINRDVLIDFLKSGEGECMLRFEVDAYILEDYLKTPDNIAGFIIKTSAYRKTAATEAE